MEKNHKQDSNHKKDSNHKQNLIILSLAALGVVYGDIGTSPLYAINEIFFGAGNIKINFPDVMGIISLVFWALTIIITIKYVIYVLRADNEGEGGVFALYGLLKNLDKKRYTIVITLLLVFAAGLLFGDGVITPAISVISAVEGIKLLAPIDSLIVPITLIILTGLFFIQNKGTAKIGSIFGPIITIWFLTIAILGARQIIYFPKILMAINPFFAFNFLFTHSIVKIFLVLGSVMLTVTGGEAMYADMGHFGKSPIRLSWFTLAYPALLLNYFGQGAFLLSGQEVLSKNIFYSMSPTIFLPILVVLATLATIIASQALITGAFSLATQASALNLLPRLNVIHTHSHHEGQKYVPFVNWSLYLGTIALVISFKSSTNLAGAYGLAVSGVMLVTTLSMLIVATKIWKWPKYLTLLLFVPLAAIDLLFFFANSFKIFEGGYIPLLIAVSIWLIMQTWLWGKRKIKTEVSKLHKYKIKDIITMVKSGKNLIPKTIFYLTPDLVKSETDNAPTLLHMFINRYSVLPKNIIFITVSMKKKSHLHESHYKIHKLYENNNSTVLSIELQYGFMERPDIEKEIKKIVKNEKFKFGENIEDWTVEMLQEKIWSDHSTIGWKKIRYKFFKLLLKNADNADHYFHVGNKIDLSYEVLPVHMH